VISASGLSSASQVGFMAIAQIAPTFTKYPHAPSFRQHLYAN